MVGGYASPAQDWRRLEIKWRKILNQAKPNGIPYYHTTDLEANPPRGIYRGWTRAEADQLTDRLIPLLNDHVKWGLAVYLLREDWLSVFESFRNIFKNRPHRVPYFLLARTCIEGLILSLDSKLPREEKIGFVFEGNDLSRTLVEGYNILANNPKYAHRFRGLSIGEDKTDFPGLQAADLLVWHFRRRTEQVKGFRQPGFHRALHKAIRADFELRYITRAKLRRAFEEFLASAPGRPSRGLLPGEND